MNRALNELDVTEMGVSLSDPYAWIVLKLPRHLREEGQLLLEDLTSSLDFSTINGEVSTRPVRVGDPRKVIRGSNIANIIHYMADPTIVKPLHFDEVMNIVKSNVKAPRAQQPRRSPSPFARKTNTSPEKRKAETSADPPPPPPAAAAAAADDDDDDAEDVPRRPKRRVTSDKYRAQYIEKTRG